MEKDYKTLLYALVNQDSSRYVAEQIADEVSADSDKFSVLFNFCTSLSYPAGMRAARALQFCVERHPSLMNPYLDQVVEIIVNTTLEGVRRSFLKMTAENLCPVDLKNAGLLMDRCIQWAISETEKPAIRYYSVEILMALCKKEPELIQEVKAVLELMAGSEFPSARAKAKNSLALL